MVFVMSAPIDDTATAETVQPNRVAGEYLAGGTHLVRYVADENGFNAKVSLKVELQTEEPQEPIDISDISYGSAPSKPQDGDEIGCALRNSLCGRK